jgi:transposase-like protein
MSFAKIDYKRLRRVSPETARIAVIEYLSSNGRNISECARTFGINRAVVYDIIRKNKEGYLGDRSRAPLDIPNKTPRAKEDLIIDIAKSFPLPPKKLSFHLFKYHNLDIAYGTLRHILRRNRPLLKLHLEDKEEVII